MTEKRGITPEDARLITEWGEAEIRAIALRLAIEHLAPCAGGVTPQRWEEAEAAFKAALLIETKQLEARASEKFALFSRPMGNEQCGRPDDSDD